MIIAKIFVSFLGIAIIMRMILKNSKTIDISFSEAVITSLVINGVAYGITYWISYFVDISDNLNIALSLLIIYIGLIIGYKKYNSNMRFCVIEWLKTLIANFLLGMVFGYIIAIVIGLFFFRMM